MKLLILTQKVDINDDVLGFFHGWIAEFAKHCEKVTVICLYKGEYDLPCNVKVLSLGKEDTPVIPDSSVIPAQAGIQDNSDKLDPRQNLPSNMIGSGDDNVEKGNNHKNTLRVMRYTLHEKVFSRLKYLINFYRYVISERSNYDNVFVHMNQIYVILGWPFWKLWNKKISLWYTHKAVSLSLRIAEKLTDKIFTASRSSFRIKSKKVNVVGHGIDINKFQIPDSKFQIPNNIYKIITVGRISPVKDYETLIAAAEILQNEYINSFPCFKGKLGGVLNSTYLGSSLEQGGEPPKFRIDIIGGPSTPEQEKYFSELKELVKGKQLDKTVHFVGKVPNKDIVKHLQNADLFVNMSHTGSLDKAVLEAMACGLPVLSCNEAVTGDVLLEFGEKLYFEKGNSKMLAVKIINIVNIDLFEKTALRRLLRGLVVKGHNMEILIRKIMSILVK